MTPYLSKILIYPIKSLDGVEVTEATVLPSGALAQDREFAIADQSGKYVNGKRYPQIHRLRTAFNLPKRHVTLHVEGEDQSPCFHLDQDRDALAAWLSTFFQFPVQILQNTQTGFPDDLASPGPTVVSEATLAAIADWFPDLSIAEVRRRFRTNLEISAVPAFWEDLLFGSADQVVPFQIGEVTLLGVNPCQRCIVPTRHSQTGQPDPQFQTTFVQNRQLSLPDSVERSRFNHFYRLCLNTRVQPAAVPLQLCLQQSVSAPRAPEPANPVS